MRKEYKKGFTLIELLVVIAIIGILSTLAVVSLGNARTRARDSKRLADLRSLQSALEIYYTDHGSYPVAPASPNLETQCLDNSNTTPGWKASGCTAGATLITVPADPGDNNNVYTYSRPDDNTYYVKFALESPIAPLTADNCLSTSGMATNADAGDCP